MSTSNAQRSMLSRVQRVLWALEGLSAVLHPDQVLDSHERATLGAVLAVVAEELGRTLEDLERQADQGEHLFRDTGRGSDTAPEAEGGRHG